jgi:hypothetical protein
VVFDVILVLDDLREYLEMTESGYVVKKNCPIDKLDELKQINAEYEQIMGETLIIFDK